MSCFNVFDGSSLFSLCLSLSLYALLHSRYFIGVMILFPVVVNKTGQFMVVIPFSALIGIGFGVFYSIEPSNFFKVNKLLFTSSHSSCCTTHIMCARLRPSLPCLSCSTWFTHLPAPHLRLLLPPPSSLIPPPASLLHLPLPLPLPSFAHPSIFLWQIIPAEQKAEFVGLYGFMGYIFRWVPPLVYLAIVEVTNDQMIAFLSITIYMVLATVVLLFVNFERGEEEATRDLGTS